MPERPKPSSIMHAPRWAPEDYRQRPRDYDPKIADHIIDMIEQGETLSAICGGDRDLPLPGTFVRWAEDEDELGRKYERAVRIGSIVHNDEILEEGRKGNGLNVHALKLHTERALPGKFGPRAAMAPPPAREDTSAGIDHGAELRRKIEQMADRARQRLVASQAPGANGA